ncbi:RING-H2 Pirh2 [Drosophila suzukii associated hytrosavirus 1]|nr:RING-H2 Pirh2 [Drosophila suzukii associated hytrosavirus 1]
MFICKLLCCLCKVQTIKFNNNLLLVPAHGNGGGLGESVYTYTCCRKKNSTYKAKLISVYLNYIDKYLQVVHTQHDVNCCLNLYVRILASRQSNKKQQHLYKNPTQTTSANHSYSQTQQLNTTMSFKTFNVLKQIRRRLVNIEAFLSTTVQNNARTYERIPKSIEMISRYIELVERDYVEWAKANDFIKVPTINLLYIDDDDDEDESRADTNNIKVMSDASCQTIESSFIDPLPKKTVSSQSTQTTTTTTCTSIENPSMSTQTDDDDVQLIKHFVTTNRECPICFEFESTTKMIFAPCSHCICEKCFGKLRELRCPMCMAEMTSGIRYKIQGENLLYTIERAGSKRFMSQSQRNFSVIYSRYTDAVYQMNMSLTGQTDDEETGSEDDDLGATIDNLLTDDNIPADSIEEEDDTRSVVSVSSNLVIRTRNTRRADRRRRRR